jgi:hypothetical protein
VDWKQLRLWNTVPASSSTARKVQHLSAAGQTVTDRFLVTLLPCNCKHEVKGKNHQPHLLSTSQQRRGLAWAQDRNVQTES